ncbi:hypothetical protein [Streptomyces sp. NPDC014623]|uniref:hypothetical protein n=1 Tax=Streptomyces sp. NPDC014623 TaxID=3364875 RepID=UPI003700C2DD
MPSTHYSSAPPVIRSGFERRTQAHHGTSIQNPADLPLGAEGGLRRRYAADGFNRPVREVPGTERRVAVLAETGRTRNERVGLVPHGLAPLPSGGRVCSGLARVPHPGGR